MDKIYCRIMWSKLLSPSFSSWVFALSIAVLVKKFWYPQQMAFEVWTSVNFPPLLHHHTIVFLLQNGRFSKFTGQYSLFTSSTNILISKVAWQLPKRVPCSDKLQENWMCSMLQSDFYSPLHCLHTWHLESSNTATRICKLSQVRYHVAFANIQSAT